jgi:hypothetical protein
MAATFADINAGEFDVVTASGTTETISDPTDSSAFESTDADDPDDAQTPDAENDAEDARRRNREHSPTVDTASLLRELSSLGFDEAAPSAPAPVAARPVQREGGGPSQKPGAKKKKGLFGR